MRSRIPAALLSVKLRGPRAQNYYKERKQRRRNDVEGGLIEQLVRGERALQPRLGGRKLFHLPEPLPAAPRTTDSLPVFHNLVKDLALDGISQSGQGHEA
jgi:hypothetical protein